MNSKRVPLKSDDPGRQRRTGLDPTPPRVPSTRLKLDPRDAVFLIPPSLAEEGRP